MTIADYISEKMAEIFLLFLDAYAYVLMYIVRMDIMFINNE